MAASRHDASDAQPDVLSVDMVVRVMVTAEERVPFAVEQVADASLSVGKVAVVREGVPGTVRNTYSARLVGATPLSRELIATEVLSAPVREVRHVGTRPVPVARAPRVAVGSIQRIIADAAVRWGASADQLLRVAYCESHYDPNAYNPSSGASGLFQFLPSTWAANSVRAGYGGASPFDAVANANTAAMMFSRGQAGQWVCK